MTTPHRRPRIHRILGLATAPLLAAAALVACTSADAPDANVIAGADGATPSAGDGQDHGTTTLPPQPSVTETTEPEGKPLSGVKGNTAEKVVKNPEIVDAVTTAVTATWNTYRSAVTKKNGAAAVAVVTPDSIQQMSVWQQMALVNTWDDLSSGRMIDVLSVLRLRAQLPVDDVRTRAPEELYAMAVDAGLIGDPAILKRKLASVEVHETMALGLLPKTGSAPAVRVVFVKDGTDWKVAINSVFSVTEATLQAKAEAASQTTAEYAVATVAAEVGKAAAEKAEQPLGTA